MRYKSMKKILTILLTLVLLTGCTVQPTDTTVETTAVSQTTETTTEDYIITTQSQFTTTAEITTTETEKSFPSEITLTAKPSSNRTQIHGCKVIEDLGIQSESDFPNKEHIRLAKEFCWNDESMKSERKSYDEDESDSEDYEKFTCADNLIFDNGISYDFDMDGENESIISIFYLPMSWYPGYIAVLYCNDNITTLLLDGCNPEAKISALDFHDFQCIELLTTYGVIGYSTEIFTIENGVPKPEVHYNNGCLWIDYSNGVFYCYPKYEYAPELIVCDTEGKFRQLDTEKITAEDLTAHVENADLLLERLSSDGNIISGIYTIGYYCYWVICGEKTFYFELKNGTSTIKDFSPDEYFSEEREYNKLTEGEYFSGIDVFALDVLYD